MSIPNSVLQQDALALDGDMVAAFQDENIPIDGPNTPCSHPYFSWTMEHTLRLMIRYLQLGFELELWANHELLVVYWSVQSLVMDVSLPFLTAFLVLLV